MSFSLTENVRHPDLVERATEYVKFRLCYEGGRAFIDRFLEKFRRETIVDFNKRRRMTYNPAFAKAAVDEVKNAIFQRLADVSRVGGPPSYRTACAGIGPGVDRMGSSMTSWIGRSVLPELLPMGKVGIWVDRAPIPEDATISDAAGTDPYLYIYRIEDVRSWTFIGGGNQGQFQSILLCDWDYVSSEDRFGLPNGWRESYRHAFINADGFVQVETHRQDSPEPVVTVLKLRQIPFVLVDIGWSLLKDAADYQVAMLNIASSDVNWITKSNLPFYTEQVDHRGESPFVRKAGDGTAASAQASTAQPGDSDEVTIGAGIGRRYGKTVERPAFIAPPDGPLRLSMDKQKQMKEEIRELIHLAVTLVGSTKSIKTLDNQGLNTGLSAIALELEHMERRIADLWALYELDAPAQVRYPTIWSMQTDEERRADAKELAAEMDRVPSRLYQKAVAKMVAEKLIGHKVSDAELQAIFAEVDAADAVTANSEQLLKDTQQGLVSAATASKLRGYAPGEVAKAQDEQAKRLAIIAISQSKGSAQARGVVTDKMPLASSEGEKVAAMEDVGPPPTRGPGK